MSLLKTAITRLRNLLLHKLKLASCCASCGELPHRLENRLCVSATPEFPVDVVFLVDTENRQDAFLDAAVALVREHMPWAGTVWAPQELFEERFSGRRVRPLPGRTSCGPDGTPAQGDFPEERLHLTQGMAGHFLVFRKKILFHSPVLKTDFFTANGLPLLFARDQQRKTAADASSGVETGGSGDLPPLDFVASMYMQTSDNAQDFLGVYEEQRHVSAQKLEYGQALARWAYTCKRGVPVVWPHNNRVHSHVS